MVDELETAVKDITELSDDYVQKIEFNLKVRKVNEYLDKLKSHYINNI